jgi:hypothetical protein
MTLSIKHSDKFGLSKLYIFAISFRKKCDFIRIMPKNKGIEKSVIFLFDFQREYIYIFDSCVIRLRE